MRTGADEDMESEERFRALVQASADVVYRMSPDWRELRQVVGREFVADTSEPGRSWMDLYIHPEDQPAVAEAIQRAIQTRSVFELEHRVLRVDGSLGWTSSRAIPVLGPDGEIREWLGMASDVTQRKATEEALRASQLEAERQRRLYEAVLNNTPDLAYIFALDHRFIYANEGLLRMWGRSWDEAIGKTCLELGYPDWHAAMHDREIEQVIATKKPIRGEVPFDGTFGRRTYDYIFVPIFDADGEVEAVAGTTRDVTDYRRAEDALRLHNERFKAPVDRAPLGIFLIDADFRMSHVNPVALPFFAPVSDLVGRDYGEILRLLWAEPYVEEILRLFRHTLATGESFYTPETPSVRHEGESEFYEWGIDRIALPEGGHGVVCYARDVTAQVRARRTIEDARAEAEEANQTKSSFLATMSHELRTPLNAIIGYSDLLDAEIAGPLTELQKTQLKRIDAGARHLLRLIEEILTFSRLEAGREELHVQPVDMADLVRETAELIEPLAAQKKLAFLLRIPAQMPAVTDPGKVRQILLNLLSNAVKFTDVGDVRLDLSLDGDWISLRVQDSGVGIAAEHQTRIFEPFAQVDTDGRVTGGTGLGLSVTEQLARLLGGTVSVVSAPKEGSTFTVTLPARSTAAAPSLPTEDMPS